MSKISNGKESYVSTQNPCKLCAPLGASLVFKGIRGAIPFLHGSQGCSTYIRRYVISHFKEPIDIASSNFSEETAIFGGEKSLISGIKNVCRQYNPEVIGLATTCLSETIGDNIPMILKNLFKENPTFAFPKIIHVSTPSYSGSHIEGFHKSVLSVVINLAQGGNTIPKIGIFPGLVSPEDIRYLKEISSDFDFKFLILPDYSQTLDGGPWDKYKRIQEGGISINDIASLGCATAVIEFGDSLKEKMSAGKFLEKQFLVPHYSLSLPIGVKSTDLFFSLIKKNSGCEIPEKYIFERERLIDSFADGHKYVFGKRAVIYGEEDFVVSMAKFLLEIGVVPIVCATGANSNTFEDTLSGIVLKYKHEICILNNADFNQINEKVKNIDFDFMIGNSKGYYIARKKNIPLIRVGFPVHDRFGAQRIQCLGYRGTQQLFDRIVNTVIQNKQDSSSIGYQYI